MTGLEVVWLWSTKKEMSGFLWLGCLGGCCCWLQQQDVVDGEGWRRSYPGDSLEEILTLRGAARYPEEWLSGFQSWCDCEICQEPPLSCLVWVVTELLSQKQLMRSLSLLHKAEVDGMHSGEVGVGIYHSGGGLACKGQREGNTDPSTQWFTKRKWSPLLGSAKSRKWTSKIFTWCHGSLSAHTLVIHSQHAGNLLAHHTQMSFYRSQFFLSQSLAIGCCQYSWVPPTIRTKEGPAHGFYLASEHEPFRHLSAQIESMWEGIAGRWYFPKKASTEPHSCPPPPCCPFTSSQEGDGKKGPKLEPFVSMDLFIFLKFIYLCGCTGS